MSEAYRSSQFKRAIVVENDTSKARSRVEFQDEDGVQSYWMSWVMGAAGGSKIYNAPDIGSQVACMVDRHGEDGVILGSTYSDGDPPPTTDGNAFMAALAGGGIFHYDKASGKLTLTVPGGLQVVGDFKAEGGVFEHEGKNVGKDHKHKDVLSGPSQTGEPV